MNEENLQKMKQNKKANSEPRCRYWLGENSAHATYMGF